MRRAKAASVVLLIALCGCGSAHGAAPAPSGGSTSTPVVHGTPSPLVATTTAPSSDYRELDWRVLKAPATGTSVVVQANGGGCDGFPTLAWVQENIARVVLHLDEKPFTPPCAASAWAEEVTITLPSALGQRHLVRS